MAETGAPLAVRRNIRVAFDFASAAIWYEWTDEPVRPDGNVDFGVFATFGAAKAVALRELRNERDRWSRAIAYHRSLTKGTVVTGPPREADNDSNA